jgi:hypothetical protein
MGFLDDIGGLFGGGGGGGSSKPTPLNEYPYFAAWVRNTTCEGTVSGVKGRDYEARKQYALANPPPGGGWERTASGIYADYQQVAGYAKKYADRCIARKHGGFDWHKNFKTCEYRITKGNENWSGEGFSHKDRWNANDYGPIKDRMDGWQKRCIARVNALPYNAWWVDKGNGTCEGRVRRSDDSAPSSAWQLVPGSPFPTQEEATAAATKFVTIQHCNLRKATTTTASPTTTTSQVPTPSTNPTGVIPNAAPTSMSDIMTQLLGHSISRGQSQTVETGPDYSTYILYGGLALALVLLIRD